MNNLEEIKSYLRIDFDDEDDFLEELLLATENYIDECVGTEYKNNARGLKLAKLLQKKYVSDLYENRSNDASEKTKRDIITNTILDILASYKEGDTNN
nr:MAG TPA: hypothetical protein [Caudoviricetes sp.]